MAVFSIGLVFTGVVSLRQGDALGSVRVAFGVISAGMVVQDVRYFLGLRRAPNVWLTSHLQRMVASYIGSLTAFLVVNNRILPSTLAWSLPTLLMVPFIVRWSRRYRGMRLSAAA